MQASLRSLQKFGCVRERRSGTQEKCREASCFLTMAHGAGDRFFVYILASGRNGTLYVGVTNDLARRVAAHKLKAVPGFTRTYGVDKLVYAEEHGSILDAQARERALKRWRRSWKLELIEKGNPNWRDLSEEFLA